MLGSSSNSLAASTKLNYSPVASPLVREVSATSSRNSQYEKRPKRASSSKQPRQQVMCTSDKLEPCSPSMSVDDNTSMRPGDECNGSANNNSSIVSSQLVAGAFFYDTTHMIKYQPPRFSDAHIKLKLSSQQQKMNTRKNLVATAATVTDTNNKRKSKPLAFSHNNSSNSPTAKRMATTKQVESPLVVDGADAMNYLLETAV
jgi:hypothetical protein